VPTHPESCFSFRIRIQTICRVGDHATVEQDKLHLDDRLTKFLSYFSLSGTPREALIAGIRDILLSEGQNRTGFGLSAAHYFIWAQTIL
jgi:hypothetical protein